jgi:DNA-directed RNA polymerase subunit H (RpoH/RPB5)
MQRGFAQRVNAFLESVKLLENEKQEFAKEIARLAMQVQTGMGSTRIRRIAFRRNIETDFHFFKTQYLDSSAYIHRQLWKAVVLKTQEKSYAEYTNSKNETFIDEDVTYMLSLLDEEDVAKIRAMKIAPGLNIDHINLVDLTTGKNKKRSFLEHVKIKRNPLSFIADNDPGTSIEDLEQDLLTEAVRVSNMYNRSKGKNLSMCAVDDNVSQKLEKYLETALNNKVMNLKEHHTCDSRRRVVSTKDAEYKKIKKLRKLSKQDPTNKDLTNKIGEIRRHIDTSGTEYFSTVSALVAADDGEFKIIDIIDNKEQHVDVGPGDDSGSLNAPMMTSENAVWIEKLCGRVDDKIAKFVRIVVGERDEDFEQWAKRTGCDTDNFDSLVRGARTFCKVTRNELAQNPVLEEIREDVLGY